MPQILRRGRAPVGSLAREALSYTLGTRAKVGCLRVLSTVPGMLTQRDVARRAGVQHRSSQIALDELVAVGIVQRFAGGRDMLVNLNRDHQLSGAIAQLFQSESELFLSLRGALAGIAVGAPTGAQPLTVALFGSVARGDDAPGSDVDLLLITAGRSTVEPALARASVIGGHVQKRFGYSVRAIAYALSEAQRRWRRREPPFPEIMRDHIVIAGQPLRNLLRG